jgi:hypothetical protein
LLKFASQKCGCTSEQGEQAELRKENDKKLELCDGCPCIGMCKPECGVFSYDYNNRQCQQCGCRDTDKETDKDSELCNGCPCIGVCRPDCGFFPYEYKKNVICQQCGCKYQDTTFKDNNIELSLIDQVLYILKSLGVTFYKPGKPMKPIKQQKLLTNTTRTL